MNTHGEYVGSVVHAFENLAYQRQLQEGEKPYESSKSTSSAGKKESIYKIILPPPPKPSNSAIIVPPKQIVRHRPKSKAPEAPTASATTQTSKLAAEENDSSALDSLNLDDEFHQVTSPNKYPQSYIKTYKVLPPFVPVPPRQPSRIPTTSKSSSKTPSHQSIVRNKRMSDSLLPSNTRTNVFLKPTKYSEDDVESDFLRGSEVSQSFIKNVRRKSPERKISTYEQNFLMNNDDKEFESKTKRSRFDRTKRDQRSRSTSSKLEEPLIDEVSLRYKEYSSNNDVSSKNKGLRQQGFHPASNDRADI